MFAGRSRVKLSRPPKRMPHNTSDVGKRRSGQRATNFAFVALLFVWRRDGVVTLLTSLFAVLHLGLIGQPAMCRTVSELRGCPRPGTTGLPLTRWMAGVRWACI